MVLNIGRFETDRRTDKRARLEMIRRAKPLFSEQPFGANDAFADESELGIETHRQLTPELKIDLEMILKILAHTG